MTKTIALLSGKGGSGKTTIALSMASLLAKCEIKTILIDCDFSTNGASFFYESKLVPNNYVSFFDVMTNNNLGKDFIKINPFLSFVPSFSNLSNAILSSCNYDEDDAERISNLIEKISTQFDVCIFDCQAGYTDLLSYLLPNINETLFVMEADAISSAAIRTLHLKIGEKLNNYKSYQIFNKATPEEYEIYNKISGGTFFTNIETVLFDWKIRKAFALSEVPDMENTSIQYGLQLLNICNVLFKEDIYRNKLKMFENNLKMHSLLEKKENVNKKLQLLNIEEKRNKITFFKNITLLFSFSSLFIFILFLFHMIKERPFSNDFDIFSLILASISILLSSFFVITSITKDKNRDSNIGVIKTLELELEDIEEDIKKMKFEDNNPKPNNNINQS